MRFASARFEFQFAQPLLIASFASRAAACLDSLSAMLALARFHEVRSIADVEPASAPDSSPALRSVSFRPYRPRCTLESNDAAS
jgi:hypothetical protein